jgi:hypothetical protein
MSTPSPEFLLRKFIYGPGLDEPICLLEVAENDAVYDYHLDGLGSVMMGDSHLFLESANG